MKRLALVIVVICLLTVGCTNAPSKDDAEQVLRQFLDFSKEARPTPILVPIRPFVEFQFTGEQVAIADSIYNSTEFGEEPVSRKDFPAFFIAPLLDYSIISSEQDDKQRTIIRVSEERYEQEEFIEELLGGYYGELETGLALNERRDEIEGFLSDRFVGDFERNYRNALTVNTFKDEVSYTLELIDGEYKIIWDETTSERAKRAEAEWEQRNREEADRLSRLLPALNVVQISVRDYGLGTVFIEAIVKNKSDVKTDDMDFFYVEAELLDEAGKPLSSDRSSVSGLKPNHSEKILLSFEDYETVDWGGNYRIRIAAPIYDLYSDWIEYTK